MKKNNLSQIFQAIEDFSSLHGIKKIAILGQDNSVLAIESTPIHGGQDE